MAFSPDSKRAALCVHNAVELWDTSGVHKLTVFHDEQVEFVAASNKIEYGRNTPRIKLWDVYSGTKATY
jgi:hypothetical protein